MSDILKLLTEVGKPKIEAVEIEGKTFHVRGMASMQRAAFVLCTHQAIQENTTVPDSVVVALGLCDENGARVGETTDVLEQIELLDGAVLYRLAKRILDLSGFSKKAIEVAEKN